MNSRQKLISALSLVAFIGGSVGTAVASDDVKALLEILLEKGVITQDEYDNKIKKAAERQEIKEFHQSQDLRKINQEIQKKQILKENLRQKYTGKSQLGTTQLLR